MLNSLICCFLSLYILFLLISTIFYTINNLSFAKKKNNKNKLSFSKGIVYLCLTLSFLVTLALYLNLMDYNSSILWFYLIFGIATAISIILVFHVVFWKVEYTNETFTYRNTLGVKKEYCINEIVLIPKKRYTVIAWNRKKLPIMILC